MRYLIHKDKKRRFFFSKNEKQLIILKSLLNNNIIKNSYKILLLNKLFNFSKYSYKSTINNRCILTGRKNVILKKYRLSRLQLPEYANNFAIKGFNRTGW